MAGVITAASAELIAAIVIMTKMPVRIFRIYEPLRFSFSPRRRPIDTAELEGVMLVLPSA
jgi:hypothetical protein